MSILPAAALDGQQAGQSVREHLVELLCPSRARHGGSTRKAGRGDREEPRIDGDQE